MNILPRGMWTYAFLLIFLFAIVSIVAWTTINDLAILSGAEDTEYVHVVNIVGFKVLALTMGFMFMSGALGIGLIRFVAEAESRLRVGQVVDGMDYLNDGLVVVDKKGRITGSNPSARNMMAHGATRHVLLSSAFPCLTEQDMALLLDMHGPNEVQRDAAGKGGRIMMRFRSQTSAGICLVMVSDVTRLRNDEMRHQQIARLELIGRLARGVALDFSNILSAVAGHAALLLRLKPGAPEQRSSVDAIMRESDRGSHLANHLLEFSHLRNIGRPSDSLAGDIAKAGDLLGVGLTRGWKVETSAAGDFPVVALSSQQIQQVVLNLGLIAADAAAQPGTIRVTAGRPSADHFMNVGDRFAAVIVISAMPSEGGPIGNDSGGASMRSTVEESGVIQSVVRTLMEEAGGSMDVFAGADGARVYRVALPCSTTEQPEAGTGDVESGKCPAELKSYVAHWKVLLARSTRGHDFLEEYLTQAGVNVERVNSMILVLSRIETGSALDSIVVEKALLGDEADGLIRAVVKLCPSTGVVVLCEDPDAESVELAKNVIFKRRRTNSADIIKAMIEARGLAVRRAVR